MQTYKISQAISGEEFKFPPIIGLTGHKGVGKSTLANALGGEIISFATPIKKMLEVIIPKRYIYEDKEDQIIGFPEGVTGRKCLQSLGTEWGRAMYSDIWINFAEIEIVEHQDEAKRQQLSGRIIIDDVRFENECRMIRRLKGEVWRVIRNGVGNNDQHISEAGLPDELISKQIVI
jgi:energy-coupling factor transporter ATP-binding protein EcfA2